jgi:hypothetical protein
MKNKKEIVVLGDRDHLVLRPTVYVGSVKPSEEKIPLIKDGRVYMQTKSISVGMYKLFDEVFSNSLDEAKRMGGKMKSIVVLVNSKKNEVTIKDSGDGFYKGTSINKTSGKTNIETAVSMFRAGSNFSNEELEDSLIGTNGLGLACVCGLSKDFKIVTVNDTHYYKQEWDDFKTSGPITRAKKSTENKGTEITFKPLSNVFGNDKWDKEVLSSILILKYNLIKRDPILSKLDVEFLWDEEKIDLNVPFIPEESFKINTEIGQISIWEKYEGSGSISFVNSAICSGIHQKIVNDFINQKLDDTLGHHFYDCLIVLNLPPKYVKFGDQNKTRFVTTREEIESLLINKFGSKLQAFFKTEVYERILKKVEERKNDGYVKKLRAEKRKINIKQSHKYFPAQKALAENLFIVEGLCIQEDEKINIWRDGELINIRIKDVLIGDEVITHEHRIRRIVNKQKKLKECVTISLKDGTKITQPKSHRYYVFDIEKNDFIFISVGDINTKKHRLVKSMLGEFIGNVEVIDKIYDENHAFPNLIVTEEGIYQCTDDHKYCIFDTNDQSFSMRNSSDIKIGDLMCVFDKSSDLKDI